MKKPIIIAALVLTLVTVYFWTNRGKTPSEEKTEQIRQFLRTVVVNMLEKDYARHGMQITAMVTTLEIGRITSEESREYIFYTAQGRVSYIIKGERAWRDREGNRIHLDPEAEITHAFTCGVREDRYGDLLQDDKNRFTFNAENVMP